MILYEGLFFFMYVFLKSMREGAIGYTEDTNAFNVIVVMSIFPVLNLSSVQIGNGLLSNLSVFTVLSVLNYIIFIYKKRYKYIVQRFEKTPPNSVLKWIGIVYLVLTLVMLFI